MLWVATVCSLLVTASSSGLDQGGVCGGHTHLSRSVSFPAFVRGWYHASWGELWKTMSSHFPLDTIGGVRKVVLTLLGPRSYSLLCGSQMVNQRNLGTQAWLIQGVWLQSQRGLHPRDRSALDIWESGMGFNFRSLCQKQPKTKQPSPTKTKQYLYQ